MMVVKTFIEGGEVGCAFIRNDNICFEFCCKGVSAGMLMFGQSRIIDHKLNLQTEMRFRSVSITFSLVMHEWIWNLRALPFLRNT